VPGPTGELTVQRKTCCLAFTLPQPKVCAGCCLRTA
jgi:ferric iron reductase protein FhuF